MPIFSIFSKFYERKEVAQFQYTNRINPRISQFSHGLTQEEFLPPPEECGYLDPSRKKKEHGNKVKERKKVKF